FQAPPRNASCRAIPLPVRWHPWLGVGGFFTGILITLPFVTVRLLLAWDSEAQLLVKKPLLEWTVRDLAIWMEDLGPWTFSYRGIFLKEQVNGRLLNALGEGFVKASLQYREAASQACNAEGSTCSAGTGLETPSPSGNT
ncbi:hypothetical protein P4O66_022604, partial [Electrophorus voltai]